MKDDFMEAIMPGRAGKSRCSLSHEMSQKWTMTLGDAFNIVTKVQVYTRLLKAHVFHSVERQLPRHPADADDGHFWQV